MERAVLGLESSSPNLVFFNIGAFSTFILKDQYHNDYLDTNCADIYFYNLHSSKTPSAQKLAKSVQPIFY